MTTPFTEVGRPETVVSSYPVDVAAQERLETLEPHISDRITSLAEESVRILDAAVCANGAMVAANGAPDGQEQTSVSYEYMWLRDAAENLYAADALGMPNVGEIRTGLVGWVNNVMLSESTSPGDPKVSHKRHEVVSGAHDETYYNPHNYDPPEWQPDQNALLAGAIIDTGPVDDDAFKAVRTLCNGLIGRWHEAGGHFAGNVENQWENHIVQGRNFTHTTLAAAYSLGRAASLVRENTTEEEQRDMTAWARLSGQLYATFEAEAPHSNEDADAPYLRMLRSREDREDGNLLDSGVTLVLPGRLRADAPEHVQRRTAATLRAMNALILRSEVDGTAMGMYRNEGDTYDGVYHPDGVEPGAGAWPLLLFSHVIALHENGNREEADELFLSAVGFLDRMYAEGQLPNNFIPEQIFPEDDGRQGKGVMPLVWSHAMYARAAKSLGYI